MKCWSFVHNIAVLCINALFPPFPMPSSFLIGFGTGSNYFRAIYLCIYLLWKSYSNYSDKKDKTRNTSVNANAHCTRRKATSFFTEFICGHTGLTSNSGVLGNGRPIPIRFPIIAQHSTGGALLSWSCWSSGSMYVSGFTLTDIGSVSL